jgi:hypothetical protein
MVVARAERRSSSDFSDFELAISDGSNKVLNRLQFLMRHGPVSLLLKANVPVQIGNKHTSAGKKTGISYQGYGNRVSR